MATMEPIGERFFAQIIDVIWTLRLPLAFLFASVVFKDLGRLRSHERQQALFMFCSFFLITATYWLIKSIKKAFLVGQYQATGWVIGSWHFNAAQVELIAKEVNVLLALLATFCFAWLTTRFKRERLVLLVIAFFGFGFLSFGLLPAGTHPLTAWMFYFYGDLFVTLMVAAFFAFLNDSGNVRMARRLYGLVGLGGVLGGFFGSTTIATYARDISPSGASWICVGTLSAMALFARLSHNPILKAVASTSSPPSPPDSANTWSHHLKILMQSPYLRGIALLVGLNEMVSAIMDYQFTATTLHYLSNEQIKVHFANVFAFTNFIALLVQLFLTRFVLIHIGVARGLLFLPAIALAGEVGFVLLPGLLMGSLLNTSNNAVAYSLNQSAKEALYVPMHQEAKYQGKALIDILVMRCAKALSIATGLLLTAVFTGLSGLQWLSLIVFGLVAAWFVCIYKINLSYKTMEARPVRHPRGLHATSA